MLQVVAYAFLASVALPIGALVGSKVELPRPVLASLLGFASGALISAVAFELFDEAFEHGGVGYAGISFLAGATVFVLLDGWLTRRTARRASSGAGIGFALLAGVTLDGVPRIWRWGSR